MNEWNAFLSLVGQCKSDKELDELFELFLTIEERRDIAKRVILVRELLEEKLSQREIADRFGISIAKITRGSNALKIISERLKTYVKRCLTKSVKKRS